jgi:hypothetical protein
MACRVSENKSMLEFAHYPLLVVRKFFVISLLFIDVSKTSRFSTVQRLSRSSRLTFACSSHFFFSRKLQQPNSCLPLLPECNNIACFVLNPKWHV